MSMKIRITMEVGPEIADPGHAMGVTEEGYNAICDALAALGHDIDVTQEEK
jgi:hypothetical protein